MTSPPDHGGAGVAVREDVQRSHARILDHLRRPGSWFTGAERLAIADESRHAADCALCTARADALSPEHVAGTHDRVSDLPEPLVELAHRVRRDPQRLSERFCERTIDALGGNPGAYAEAVGIVAFTAGLDAFCRALGIPPFALPEALHGAPSHHVPANLKAGIAWLPILAPEDATGPEADLYDDGFVPNIARALSSVPDHVRVLQEESATHYVKMSEISDPGLGRDLDRLQMELVAARVSALNECFY